MFSKSCVCKVYVWVSSEKEIQASEVLTLIGAITIHAVVLTFWSQITFQDEVTFFLLHYRLFPF